MVRLAFVLLALSGPGILFYLVAWLMMPKGPE
jgi:phage shock protein PspC (stress-responsive transcriptional regulator)